MIIISNLFIFIAGLCGALACYPLVVDVTLFKKYYMIYIIISILSWLAAISCIGYLIMITLWM
jgi:ABC-type uncharacterized transport system involved in gliding motility auxiliary subunit